jgi:ABC-type uncharacterized transport system permease subunit
MIAATSIGSNVIFPIALFLMYAASASGMLSSVTRPRLDLIAWALLLLSLIAHSDGIAHMMRVNGTFNIGLLEATSMLAWTLAVVAALISIDRRNRALGAILLLCAATGASFTKSGYGFVEAQEPRWELTAHILLSMAAAALLFAAAVTSLLLVFLDRRLRSRRLAQIPKSLPPLDTLERVMFRLIGTGFALLTLALFTGFVFVTNLFTQHLVHKTVLSLIAWVLFATLLIGRLRFGWRGRAALRWTVSGFAVLLLAYFGSKFVLESVLGRHWG